MASCRTESLVCSQCGARFRKSVGQANRQRRVLGDRVRFFCTQQCFGASRRVEKEKQQRVAEKAEYDRNYRAGNVEMLKAKKHERHLNTYDPEAARTRRQEIREWHQSYSAEYRARPEWKEHKVAYDRQRRASEYGAFAECYGLLIELEREIRRQPWYERAKERGYYDNFKTVTERKMS